MTVLIYSQTFFAPFQFDDEGAVVNNHLIRELSAVRGNMGRNARLVGMVSLALNYHLHGLHVFGYHLVNILIHLANGMGVWWLTRLVLMSPALNDHTPLNDRHLLGFLAALVFLTHPVQTQAVVYISQRIAALATLFYLIAVCCYLQVRYHQGFKKWIYGIVGGIAALLGVYTKETVLTLPLTIILLETILWRRPWRWRSSWPLVFLVMGPILFGPSIWQRFTTPFASESHAGDIITLGPYLITQVRVAARLFFLLLFPINQTVDYDFPLSYSPWDGRLWLSALFLAGWLLAAFRSRSRYPLISLGIGWMFVTFSVNLVPRANLIAEHKLYLISVGFCLAAVMAIRAVAYNKRELVILVCLWAGALGLATFYRNKVWLSETRLWSDVVKKAPNKPRGHINLAMAYQRQGQTTRALNILNHVLRDLDPDNARALNNRGGIYAQQGRYDQALMDFNRVLSIHPRDADAYVNRGAVYLRKKHYNLALRDYNQALRIKGGYTAALLGRGNAWARMGQYAKAEEDYSAAIARHMVYPEVFRNRGNVRKLLGDFRGALADYNTAIRLAPGEGITYFHRSLLYQARQEWAKAWRDIQKARQLHYPVPDGYRRWIQQRLASQPGTKSQLRAGDIPEKEDYRKNKR